MKPVICQSSTHWNLNTLLRHVNSLPGPRSIPIAAAMCLQRPIYGLRLFAEGTLMVEYIIYEPIPRILRWNHFPELHPIDSTSRSTFGYTPTGPEFCDTLAAATSLLHLQVVDEILLRWDGPFHATVPSL